RARIERGRAARAPAGRQRIRCRGAGGAAGAGRRAAAVARAVARAAARGRRGGEREAGEIGSERRRGAAAVMASSGPGDTHAREIAIGLAAAVNAAIASGYPARMSEVGQDVPPLAWTAAADVAELLDLPGLVSLLMACAAGAVAAPTAISN